MNNERCALRALVLVGLMIGAMPSIAASHHDRQTSHHHAKASPRHGSKPKHDVASTPKGVVAIPASGLKIYCPGRKNPLLVRKFTQGSGTTVTALCR